MLLPRDLQFNFPDAPDFISETPIYSATEIIRMMEPYLPFWNEQRYSKPEPEFIGDEFRLVDLKELVKNISTQ